MRFVVFHRCQSLEFYCLPDLIHCYQNKKITNKGFKLIIPLINSIQNFRKDYLKTKKFLNRSNLLRIEKLEKFLIEKRKHYKLKNRRFSLKNF